MEQQAKQELNRLTELDTRRTQQLVEIISNNNQVTRNLGCLENAIRNARKKSTWLYPQYVSEKHIKHCEAEGKKIK